MLRKKYDFDLIVIGSGAGGSVGAHYAADKGKRVGLFEKGAIGGECPNFACVPTKALLHVAHINETVKHAEKFGIDISSSKIDYAKVHRYKNLVVSRTGAAHGEESFKRERVTLIREKAEFISPHEVKANGKVYSADKFLVATGTVPMIPPIDGLKETGYLTFKEAIDLKELPDSLFILGGGVVACELSQIFRSMGSKVTIAIRGDKLLNREEEEVQDLVGALFENDGIKILSNTSVIKVEKNGKKKKITYRIKSQTHTTEVDDIIVATGKTPVLSFAPEEAGIEIEHHKIVTNEFLQTTMPNIYVAGDLAGPYLFTHTGYYQSYIAAHNAFSNKKIEPDYRVIPRCVFTSPEIASVGITQKQAEEDGIKVKVGIAPIAILGRANTSSEMDGFVKLVVDKKDRILGAAIVAPNAGEMIHTVAIAMKMKAKSVDLANMIVAYPTFSEGIKLAANSIE